MLGPADRPIAWWEWLFAPIIYPIVLVAALLYCLVAIPAALLYPDQHFHLEDMGTERQVQLMRRYRRFTARVTLWRRIGRALAFPFRRRPTRLHRRRV